MSRNVTFIPARTTSSERNDSNTKPKLKVAAYCRVSTESDEQAISYEAQISHYTNYINSNPEWELAGIFADDGISGTNTKKREEFNRMIECCMEGEIDMVITKSISRFARNTLDCLQYIRQLKDKNIPIFFEKENINTMDAKGEVMITIMASLAQQESQSLSQNVKLGFQYRYQKGEIQINCKRFLGYTKDENKKLIIEPKEAEVVKRIYREYLEGASLLKIARGLESEGIVNGAGNKKWHTSNINQILRNEKYIGDALLQKTYTVNFLTKERVKNDGKVPQYYVENSHEAIIPREIYMQVQEELVRRRSVHTSPNGRQRSYSANHCFSQMIFCGECKEIFRRVHWNNRGKKSVVWRCSSRLENTGIFCNARTVNEQLLEEIMVKAINGVVESKKSFIKILNENIASVLLENNEERLEQINERLLKLQDELVKLATKKQEYSETADEIFRLQEDKQKLQLQDVDREEQKTRMKNLSEFISNQKVEMLEYDEKIVRLLIEKVEVFDDRFNIEFKAGVEIEIKG